MRWIFRILSFFVLFGLIVLSLVATVPLRFIVEQIPSDLPLPVEIVHVQGTVIDGNVAILLQNLPFPNNINSKIKMLSIAWQWCPSLETGLSAMCVEADTELVQGTFTTVMSPTAVELYDVSLTSELKRLPIPIRNNTTEISGNIQLSLSSIIKPLPATFPSQIQGEIIVQNVVVGIFKVGNFYLNLNSNENQELTADINGDGELFSAQGIASLAQDGQYQYNIDVESGHTLVRNLLSRQGQANDKGGYRLAKTGVLPAM